MLLNACVVTDEWVYAARKRLVPNVLINGLTFSEYAKRANRMFLLLTSCGAFRRGIGCACAHTF